MSSLEDLLKFCQRYEFVCPGVELRAFVDSIAGCVVIALESTIFPSVVPEASDGDATISLEIDPRMFGVADLGGQQAFIEHEIQTLWESLFAHEFQEWLQRDGRFVFNPHNDPDRDGGEESF